MSNNLVSQYPISDRHAVKMEHSSNSMDIPPPDIHRNMGSLITRNHESLTLYGPPAQRGLAEPLYSNPGVSMVPNNRVGHDKSSGGSIGSNPILMSGQLICEDASMLNNMASENISFPVKRKAEVGPLSDNSIPQPSLSPNKRPGRTGSDVNSLGFVQSPAQQRTTVSAQPKFGFPDLPAQPSPKKKMVRNDSLSTRSGLPRGQTSKKQISTLESTSKGRPESLEAVRSKMRESLAGALAFAFQNVDNVSNTVKTQSNATQASESNSTMGGHVPISGSEGVYPLKGSASPVKTDDGQGILTELPPDERCGIGEKSFLEFQYSSGLPDEDVPFGDDFFVQDDLLQGHGLSWAFDFNVQMSHGNEEQSEGKSEIKEEDQDQRVEAAKLTPENLALKIEAELFKLFGDVNKKYREKGRSLLFNLKDRNNPELRERVMSGEISPEKLCSMSAEELASKELSEWRMAKAEELAQMVVLPDAEVDIRRLVRKTHKGEYQVEVEHEDGIAADVSGGISMSIQPQSKKETEAHSPSEASFKDNVAGQAGSSEHELSGSVIIPTNGTDLMRGMMVDELKDAEFLPPIVSLDEFMESLNSESPFDSLSKDAGQRTPISSGENPKLLRNSRAANRTSESAQDSSSRRAGNVRKREADVKTPRGRPAKLKSLSSSVPKVEYIWDGVLKLNSSSSVTVGGIFQSGETTSTKEWPKTLEMKGRVRLEAFEKFVHDLPMSRTRAVMVIHFVLKDKSNYENANLSEAIEAYSMDKRLGYAEPDHGTELYLCPPTSRITDLIDKQMPTERPQTNDSIERRYLIGVVVWRRAHTSSSVISPNSSSHHKNSSKKQPVTPSKRVRYSSNAETNTHSRTPPPAFSKSQPLTENDGDNDDDIPPGFGPGVVAQPAKDDDDLPEYNFSGDLNPSMPRISPQNLHHGAKMSHPPVDQMRELIKRYGRSGTNSVNSSSWKNLGFEPWNDDDDDIPEWRPETSHQPHKQQRYMHVPPINNQQFAPKVAHHSPTRRGKGPPGGRWVQPPGPPHSARWRQQ